MVVWLPNRSASDRVALCDAKVGMMTFVRSAVTVLAALCSCALAASCGAQSAPPSTQTTQPVEPAASLQEPNALQTALGSGSPEQQAAATNAAMEELNGQLLRPRGPLSPFQYYLGVGKLTAALVRCGGCVDVVLSRMMIPSSAAQTADIPALAELDQSLLALIVAAAKADGTGMVRYQIRKVAPQAGRAIDAYGAATGYPFGYYVELAGLSAAFELICRGCAAPLEHASGLGSASYIEAGTDLVDATTALLPTRTPLNLENLDTLTTTAATEQPAATDAEPEPATSGEATPPPQTVGDVALPDRCVGAGADCKRRLAAAHAALTSFLAATPEFGAARQVCLAADGAAASFDAENMAVLDEQADAFIVTDAGRNDDLAARSADAAQTALAMCATPAAWFATPSRNVSCFVNTGDAHTVICHVISAKRDFILDATGGTADTPPGRLLGDPGDEIVAALEYGKSVLADGVRCTSKKSGLRCESQDGSGFELSRAAQRTF
jgi:hypothetical protein